MKANAPEKSYIFNPEKREVWFSKTSDKQVEYTRTDVFIEKAKKWFIEHVNITQDVETNEDGEPLADSYIKYAKERLNAANEMFADFEKYMKGE